MALVSGTRLGPYEILALIGAGGMGEVYKATDTRLDRTVAIKVLPEHLAASPEFKARFEREAKAISQLNHPHICTLYEFDSQEDIDFLVMEHLEGESLQDRLTKGELPLALVLKIAVEITEALDEAHHQGIIHRDLKPGNIFLTAGGIKLLDFGLAKFSQTGLGSEESTKLTAQGSVLGTFHYMAPELLEGHDANACTDIWAFGCVLYEMLTGQKLFDGKSVVEVVAAISKQDPAWERIPDWMPSELQRLLRRCVHRDIGRRLQHIADTRLELLDALDELDQPRRDSTSGPLETRQVVKAVWTLSTEVCRHLNRENFDPAMIGDHVEFLDNQRSSDRLVVYLPPVGMDHSVFTDVLRSSPYRGIALTPYGMEPSRSRRIPLHIADHFTIVRLFLEHLSEHFRATHTVVTGFSSGADFACRLVSEGGVTRRHIDGLLALGSNIDLSSCFYTGALARIPHDDPDGVFRVVRDVMGKIESAEGWLRLNPYWVDVVRKHHGDVEAVSLFARDIVAPLLDGRVYPLAEWYRAAKQAGLAVRIVFSSAEDEQAPLRDLLLAHIDQQILGPDFVDADIATAPDTGHFDLVVPAVIEHYLAEVFDGVRVASA
jgi:serine/threonine protein kinase